MARSAATVKTPGATAAKADKPAKAPPSNVEQQAKAHTANGPVDPTKLKNPVFVEDQGWVCPAKPEQITVEATAEVADAEDETEDDET